MAESHIFTLFRRGRYFRVSEADSSSPESKEAGRERRECERFAMAAIGLVLEYDPAFQQHFLESVLRVSNQEPVNAVKIEVEPCHWADLRIGWAKGDGNRYVAVVEGKIGASLQPEQDYRQPEFLASGGYGQLIRKAYATEGNVQCRYVVLGAKEPLGDMEPGGLPCRHVRWADLEKGFPETEMALDLADCLGKLGVPAFSRRKTNDMKIIADMKVAAEAWDIFSHACSKARIQSNYTKPDIDSDGNGWYFGWSLNQKSGGRVKAGSEVQVRGSVALTAAVQPRNGSSLGWIGYENDGARARAAVWFYCGSLKAERRVVDRLEGRNAVADADHSVCVCKPESCATGDRDWFVEVLKAVGRW